MKIIIVNDFGYVNGGASQVAINSAIGLSKRGYKVIFFSAVGPTDNRLSYSDNIEVINLGEKDILNNARAKAVFSGIWNLNAAKKMKELLQNEDKDSTVVHLHSYTKALSGSIIQVIKKYGFRLIYHLHDYGLVCPNLGLYNYQKEQICNLEPMSFKCMCTNCDSRSYNHKLWRLGRQSVNDKIVKLREYVDTFISVSDFSYNILKESIKHAKNELVFNPIDVNEGEKVNAINSNQDIIFVGRLSKEKDPLIVAEACKRLSLPVVFVGEGDLEKEILRINPSAKITGWLEQGEVIKRIKKARVLIFSSKWYETQGMVVPEAAAYGVPSVVADTSAASDFIKPGLNGEHFKAGNVESLMSNLQKIYDNKIKEYSDNAYKMYWDNPYSFKNHLDKLENIYLN